MCAVLFPLLGLPFSGWSQDVPLSRRTASVERVITATQVYYPGAAIQQERRLTRQMTVIYGAGLYAAEFSEQPPNLRFRFMAVRDRRYPSFYQTNAILPYVFTEIRQYFSLDRRMRKEKNTAHNAANYISIFGELPLASGRLTETGNLVMAYPVGVKIGMRRNLGGHFYLDASAGFAAKFNPSVDAYAPRLDAALGFAF